MHGGNCANFQPTFVEIQIGGTTALANHVDNRGPLRAQTRCQMNSIAAANAGSDGWTLRNDSALWNRRAVKLAVNDGKQAVV